MPTTTDHPPNAFQPLTLVAAFFVHSRRGSRLPVYMYGPETCASGTYALGVPQRTKGGALSLGAEFAEHFDSVESALTAVMPEDGGTPRLPRRLEP